MKNKISIYDVAKKAGVSCASVSYVVNGVNKVSEKTKAKILRCIDELGYIPDNGARYLTTGRSHYVGLLLPTFASVAFEQNPFYGEFIGGLEEVLSAHDYDLVVSGVKENRDYRSWFMSRSFDAVVLLGKYPKAVYDAIKKMNIPTVLIDVYEEYAKRFNNIRINDKEGTYLATKYLIEQGHTNIGFISGDASRSMLDKKRFEGFEMAMLEINLPIREENIYSTVATFDGGHSIAKQIMENTDMTAIVCAADILAIGIMRYYIENGKKLPEALSIVGFDDIRDCAYVYPGLTTVHQDIRLKGSMAADILIDSLNNPDAAKKSIELQPYLVVRQSVKKIKKIANY